MILTLSNLYQRCEDTTKNGLILTNFRFINQLENGSLKEDDCHTKRNTEMFKNIRVKFPKCLVSVLSLKDITAKEAPNCENLKDDTAEILELVRTKVDPSLENICFMDMRASTMLAP